MIRIAIVEDDEKVAGQLMEYCHQFALEAQTEIKPVWYPDGLVLLDAYFPQDIIFLDIEMPYLDGLEVAKKIRQKDTKVIIIFVTNMAQFAIKGYEVNALDFVVKPVNYHNFSFRLKKAFALAEREKMTDVLIRQGREIRKVNIADILYIENLRHRVRYVTRQGEMEEYISLAKVEEKLKGKGFEKCNSCYLVNLAFVQEIKTASIVIEGVTLDMSRSKKKEFISKLTVFLGGGGG